ncbi:hypothetical protein [Litoribacter populi]|uniref:hypothetical protein n=1 Tax=Litoribacter populi TaxID=2598460 RepID=UPI00117D60DD|nr:hypothetical protein [Litoribacter populi]
MATKVFSYGVRSVKASLIDPVTGLAVELEDVGEIYRDTITFTQDDPTVTDHPAELKDDPIISVQRKGAKNLALSLMDTSAANCHKYLGGTVVSVEGEPDEWNEGDTAEDIEMAFEFELEDGSTYGIRRGKVMGKLIPAPTKVGMTMIQIQVKPQQPLVAGLSSTYKRNPA